MKNTIIYYLYLWYYRLILTLDIISADTDLEKHIALNRYKAFKIHARIRQRYDKKLPYFYHLNMVGQFVDKFKHLLTTEEYPLCYKGAMYHDAIEDTPFYTYNDVKDEFGIDVAEIVYACTELRGKNRAERHGPEYINVLKLSRLGIFVKLCDICANMTMGVRTKSSMLKKYQKEYPTKIKANLYREEFKEIFDYIEANLLTVK